MFAIKIVMVAVLYLTLLGLNTMNAQNLSAIETRATEHFETKNYSKGLKDCEIILKRFPDNISMLNLKGKILLALNEIDTACICFIEGIELEAKSSQELFVANCTAYSPKFNLEKFKSGRFTYDLTKEEITIIRKKNLHIEHFKASNTFVKSEIYWRNHNAYQLKLIETNDPVLSNLEKGFKLNCKVIKVDEDYYIYYTKSMGSHSFGKLRKVE